jgi:phosphoglycerate dehydrogenase-like enzyme
VERVLPADGLDAALASADVVVVAAPETGETHHLFDAARIARMKPGALLLNVARGRLVDEEALGDGLARGNLGAAALDVTEREPLPDGHPLYRARNLLLTPHVSAVSDRLWHRQGLLLAENLRRFLDGEPLHHVVDKSFGY